MFHTRILKLLFSLFSISCARKKKTASLILVGDKDDMLSYVSMHLSFFQPKYLVVLVLASYLVFGFHHLTQFVTADERYWVYERIPQYWQALAEGKWKKTFINDKPGVSVALVSGSGLFFVSDPEKHFEEQDNRILKYETNQTERLYFSFRLPLLLANLFCLVLLFVLLNKLSGSWVALFTVTLSALSPILLGISQIVNPDTLLWSCSTLAFFSFFSLLRFEEMKYLWLTVLFTAFAILSKYVAIILLPFFLAVTIFRFLSADEAPETLHTLLKKDLRSWVFIVLGSLGLVCFFLPALLTDSKYLVEFIQTVPDKELLTGIALVLLGLLLFDTFLLKNRLLLGIRRVTLTLSWGLPLFAGFFILLFAGLVVIRNFFPDWSIFTAIAFDIKDLSDARYYTSIPNFFEAFLLEWNPLVFSLTPITLIGFFALLSSLFQKKNLTSLLLPTAILFFFLLYTVLLIYSNVLTTPRYSILLYPLFAYLAALGFYTLVQKIPHPQANLLMFLLLFISSLFTLFLSKPFYFNYTNSLLPKTSLIQDAWGYGGYEAARYLNSLPNAKDLTVWADYYGVCEFFVGKCLTAYTFDKEEIQPDYYVLTRRGKMRYMSRSSRWERLSGLTAYKYYGLPSPDWELFIGDRPGNFIRVVKVAK